MLQYSTLKTTVVQDNSRHTGAGIEWTGKSLIGGEEAEDDRAKGLSAIGDREQSCKFTQVWCW